MTPEELVDDMANKASHVDDEYINATGKLFAEMGLEGIKRFIAAFHEKCISFTGDQKHNIQVVNHKLAQNEDFCRALRAFNEWKAALTPEDFAKEMTRGNEPR